MEEQTSSSTALLRRPPRPMSQAEPARSPSSPVTVIDANLPRTKVELRELWAARELALTFAWRDVKVRYKQSLFGVAWAIVQPLFTMVVFSYIFGHFARFPSQGLTYPVFVYLGILPWTFFSGSLGQISASVLGNRALVQKVYFPRLILPLSGLLVPAVDFCFSATVLAGLMVLFHVGIDWHIVLAPLFLLLLAATAVAVGSVFAAITVRYRDVPYVIPFVIQIWLYLSPVIYPTSSLPHRYQVLSSFNPVVAAVTGFRWAVGGTPPPGALQLGLGLPSAAALLAFGFWFYRRWESRFADQL